jgi:vancomycin resistance protein VanJ
VKRVLKGILVAAVSTYAGLVLLIVTLPRTPLGTRWWLRLGGDFLPFWFLPLLVLVPLACVSRSRVAKLVICVPCLVFVVLYGQLFLPNVPGASAQGEQTVTVMTHNLTMGEPGLDEILNIIESSDADVVVLQEVSPKVATALSQLTALYPFQAAHPIEDVCAGSAVLSRFPIVQDKAFPLADGKHLYQRSALDVEGRRLNVLNVHLLPPWLPGKWRAGHRFFLPAGYDTTVQDQELVQLLADLDSMDGPVVVAGDFNMTDQSASYRALASRLGDTFREVGWGFGFTFPDQEVGHLTTVWPFLRIDHIFHSRDMTALRAQVGDRGGPNHRFLVAELAF